MRHAYHRSNLTSDTLAYSEADSEVTKPEGAEVRISEAGGFRGTAVRSTRQNGFGQAECSTATERSNTTRRSKSASVSA
ncbi:hypothetical protein RB298_32830 [Priestia sp. BR_2]